MAATDYSYQIFSTTLSPLGPAVKENMDITRLVFDFSCWVDQTVNEVISVIEFPTIMTLPYGLLTNTWSVDYPYQEPVDPSAPPPPDTYPLRVLSEAITTNATTVEIKVTAGTPGFSYDIAFLVTGSVTARRKQVEVIVQVEQPTNTAMLGPGDIGPSEVTTPLFITDTTALPMGFEGLVILNNSGNRNGIVLTLPPNPTSGQFVEFIDQMGTDGQYPVTILADSNAPVDGDGSTSFVSTIAFDVLKFTWMTSNWHLQSRRFGFLG